MKKIVIVTGEKSGNNIITPIVEKLSNSNQYNFFIVGDPNFKKFKNTTLIMDRKKFSVMGFTDVLINLRKLKKNISNLKKSIFSINPDLIILVDSPDLNLKLAKDFKKKSNVPIIYVVSPTVWAWRYSRIYTIKKYINFMALIFPFEEKIYKKENINAEYIGHPFFIEKKFDSIQNCTNNTIGIFPGSRAGEIKRMAKSFSIIIKIIKQKSPETKFIVSKVNGIDESLYEPFKNLNDLNFEYDKFKIFSESSFLFVKSGTMTMDALFSKKPFFIFYKTTKLNYFLANLFISKKLKYIGMPNILANKQIIDEFVQKWNFDEIVEKYFYMKKNQQNFDKKREECFNYLENKNYVTSLIDKIKEFV